MVWNDFWASTQDYNVEPQDVPLFLANARDVVRRFRNHPSIVIWCGRNEGVPQPILNDGLDRALPRRRRHPLLHPRFKPHRSPQPRPVPLPGALALLHHSRPRLLRRTRHRLSLHPRSPARPPSRRPTSGPSATPGHTTTGTVRKRGHHTRFVDAHGAPTRRRHQPRRLRAQGPDASTTSIIAPSSKASTSISGPPTADACSG